MIQGKAWDRGLGRWAVAAVPVGITVVCLATPVLAHPGRSAAQPGPAALADQLSCLDTRLQPASECPSVEIAVDLAAAADETISVVVTNRGSSSWRGGPVAVELPVPGAVVDRPEGYRGEGFGDAGWVTRSEVVVARCVFEPVEVLAPNDSLSCLLPRLGLADGEHMLWLTGFVGGLPEVVPPLSDEPPAVGVVPMASSRAISFTVDGTSIRLLAPSAAAPDGLVDGGDAGGAGLADRLSGTGGLALLALAAMACLAVRSLRRRRDRSSSGAELVRHRAAAREATGA